MELITRYRVDGEHGWYVGSASELVLAPREHQAWPGMFEAYCRLRGRGPEDLEFRSPEDEREFLDDVRLRRGPGTPVDQAGDAR